MHILVVDTTLTTPPTGGAQTFLLELVEFLGKRTCRFSIATQRGPEFAVLDALARNGAEVIADLWDKSHLPEEKALRLAKWVNGCRPDLYIVSISPDVGWLTLPLLDDGIVTMSIAHNDASAFYAPLKHYHPFVDCAVGVSETTYKRIIEQCCLPVERARHIPYGVKSISSAELRMVCSRTVRATPALRLGYLGRLVQEQKRILDFALLASELSRRNVAFELHLIGDGPQRRELEARLRRNGVETRVRMPGWLPPEEVKAQLLQLDVFVLMSEYEGLSVALLEGMAHALVPVVTKTQSGNIQLVQDGENGFVVPIRDIGAFCDRLEYLANDRELLIAKKRAAWETAQEFSVEKMCDRYLAAFDLAQQNASLRAYRCDLPDPYPLMASCRSKYPVWLRKMKKRLRRRSQTDAHLESFR